MTSNDERFGAVWIVNHYATDPAQSASGSRHFSLARRLAQLGWTPTILAASTDHPSGTQRRHLHVTSADEEREGVRFRYLRAPSYSSGLGRLLNIFVFTIRVLSPSSVRGLEAPRVIIGSTVHPLAAWAASLLSKRAGVPFIFEVRDLWPQTLIDMGKLRERGLVARAMRMLERKLCERAVAIVTLLPFAYEYFADQGIPTGKVVWISNGTDVDEFGDPAPVQDAVNREFTIMYLGSIGRANDVLMILKAFLEAASRDPRLRLEIVGRGPDRTMIQEVAERSAHARRVAFRDPVVKTDVPRLMAEADALVINVLDLDVYRFGVSMNKMFDYAAAARPMIISTSARNNLVADADAGITVEAGDVRGLTEAMVKMAAVESSDDRARWAQNARTYAITHFDYAVLGMQLHEVLLSVCFGPENTGRAFRLKGR